MIERLRLPGGRLGTWTVVCAGGLALIGGVVSVAMLLRLAVGGSFWSDDDGDVVAALVFALVGVAGAVGLIIQDRLPWPGAALAIVGGVAVALILFWAVVPVVLGIAVLVVATQRARAFSPRQTVP